MTLRLARFGTAAACAWLTFAGSMPGGTAHAAPAAPAAASGAASGAAAGAAPGDVAPIDTLKRIRDTATITLGVRESRAPFSFVDAQREPQGYSIDLCMRVADAVKDALKLPKLDVRFVVVTPANRVAMLGDGRIDLECGSTVNTRKRDEDVAFAYTTFVSGVRLLARRASKVTSIDGLHGRTVVAVRGTPAAKLLRQVNAERALGLTILEARDDADAFAAVADGRAVALPMEDVALHALIARAARPGDFAVVGGYLSIEPRAIMLRKDDPAFERLVDRALAKTFRGGEFGRIYARWFSTREFSMPMSRYLREALAAPTTYPAFP